MYGSENRSIYFRSRIRLLFGNNSIWNGLNHPINNDFWLKLDHSWLIYENRKRTTCSTRVHMSTKIDHISVKTINNMIIQTVSNWMKSHSRCTSKWIPSANVIALKVNITRSESWSEHQFCRVPNRKKPLSWISVLIVTFQMY